jgi:exosortase
MHIEHFTRRIAGPALWFGVYTSCLVAVYGRSLVALTTFASANPTGSHVVFVPLVTIALIYVRRDSIFSTVRPSLAVGFPAIALGSFFMVAALLFGDLESALSFAVAGFVLSWIGGFVLLFGVTAARAAVFPLAFLGFMIPVPEAVIDAATSVLKSGSAETVNGLFLLTGVLYHREGFVFSLPTFAIEIADECSGIRSSIALLLTTLPAGHLFLRSPWAQALLLLAVLPIAVLKNAIRIVSLCLLAIHVDPSYLTGQLHHEGGVVFLLVAMALMVPVFIILRRSETLFGSFVP